MFGPRSSSVFAEIGYVDYLWVSNDRLAASLVNNTALPTSLIAGDPRGPGFLAKFGISRRCSTKFISMSTMGSRFTTVVVRRTAETST